MAHKPNPWESKGDDKPIIVRQTLKDATFFDRFLMVIFVFVLAALATAGVFIYIATRTYRGSSTPVITATGKEARQLFLLVTFIGGVVGSLCYYAFCLVDSYKDKAETKIKSRSAARKNDSLF